MPKAFLLHAKRHFLILVREHFLFYILDTPVVFYTLGTTNVCSDTFVKPKFYVTLFAVQTYFFSYAPFDKKYFTYFASLNW